MVLLRPYWHEIIPRYAEMLDSIVENKIARGQMTPSLKGEMTELVGAGGRTGQRKVFYKSTRWGSSVISALL